MTNYLSSKFSLLLVQSFIIILKIHQLFTVIILGRMSYSHGNQMKSSFWIYGFLGFLKLEKLDETASMLELGIWVTEVCVPGPLKWLQDKPLFTSQARDLLFSLCSPSSNLQSHPQLCSRNNCRSLPCTPVPISCGSHRSSLSNRSALNL